VPIDECCARLFATMRVHIHTLHAVLVLGNLFTPACGGGANGGNSTSTPYIRSDDPEVVTSWQSQMPIYRATHQDEAAVVASLDLDTSTRTFIDVGLNRVRYTTPSGVVQVFYDDGFDKPFHTLKYLRNEPFQAQTWSDSADLYQKWQQGARLGAEYIGHLTKLRPLVLVGVATDEVYADALAHGYDFMLAIDDWPLWVDDMHISVDASGIYEFATDELAYSATEDGVIDCRTKDEVEAMLTQGGYAPLDSTKPLPIFYGFDVGTEMISPFYLAVSSGEGGLAAIPMDRAVTSF
jgi:hypothetical protein